MEPLTREQRERLTERLLERKALLLGEIQSGLAPSGRARYIDLLGAGGDAGDESVANLLRDVAEAEIIRDVGEVRDIVAAEARLADGTYGVCIDCGKDIRYARLDAYPSAKRCIDCQQHREKTRAPSPYTGR